MSALLATAAEVAMARRILVRSAPLLGTMLAALALLPGCGGGGGSDGGAGPPEALVRCAGLGGARMWALVPTCTAILKHVDYTGSLPAHVTERSILTYAFDLPVGGAAAEHAEVALSASYDIATEGFPVNKAIVLHWALTRGTTPAGEGRYSVVRLSPTALNFSPLGLPPAGALPRFEPEPGCAVDVDLLNLFVPFAGHLEQVLPTGSNFSLVSRAGGAELSSQGFVGNTLRAAMSGTYQGAPFAFTVDLATGDVTRP